MLPIEYQEVEYIQNGSEQSIDTGWYRDYSKNIEIETQVNLLRSDYRYCILSDYAADQQYALSCEVSADNKGRFYINATNDLKTSNNISSGQFIKIIFRYEHATSIGSIIADDVTSSMNFSDSVKDKVSTYSAFIFVDRPKRYSTFNQPMQIKSLKIKENGVLVRDFVPCYRKSDNVSGLYDVVNNVFYTNQENTGNFAVGRDVHNWVLDLQAMDIYTEDTVQGNLHNAFEPPYPADLWYVTDAPDVTHDGALDVIPMGAFFNTPLRKIVIPSSVTSIGHESFQQTALTHVTLPDDCEYYSTSFPEDCVVTGGRRKE